MELLQSIRKKDVSSHHRQLQYKDFASYPSYIQQILLLPEAKHRKSIETIGATASSEVNEAADRVVRPMSAAAASIAIAIPLKDRQGFPLHHIEGLSLYLMGRVYQEWNSNHQEEFVSHQTQAYGYYTRSLQPSHLLSEVEEWGDGEDEKLLLLLLFCQCFYYNFTKQVSCLDVFS